MELVSLVAMMIAGYPSFKSPGSDMWLALTAELFESLTPSPYLHVLTWFLRDRLKSSGAHDEAHIILDNNSIDLNDRVAFACKFLPYEQVWKARVVAASACA